MNNIDTNTLKSSLDLRHLASRYTTLRGREGQKEWYGSCPKCRGKDRFHATQSGFFCSNCQGDRNPKRHDAIEFIMWMEGLSFHAACEWLARDTNITVPTLSSASPRPTRPMRLPEILTPPDPTWQVRARAFVEDAQRRLWQPTGHAALNYLAGRGFTEGTMRAAGLGYNPHDINDAPDKWGVTGRDNIWLPGPGIVIPWFIGGDLWRVNIRLLEKRGDWRYIGPAGFANGLYNADALTVTRPAILVEGELDALIINQLAGDIITAVATGSTEGSRRDKWIAKLATAPLVLVAFDADLAGDKAARFWLDILPNAKRWRPYWKDANAMVTDGADIRAWIETGLPIPSPFLLVAATPYNHFPVVITWPADVPVTAIGDNFAVDLNSRQIRATYHTAQELDAAVWAVGMIKEAIALGGVVSEAQQ